MPPIRILAIEDDLIFAESLRSTIESSDHILIDIVDEPESFRRLVRSTLPDVMIFDIELGQEIDGIALALEVTKTHDVPYIFLSSIADKEIVKKATETLPAAYLLKPSDPTTLDTAISLATKRHQKNHHEQISATSRTEFFLKIDDHLSRIDLDRLLYVEAMNKQTKLFFKDETKTVNMLFGEIRQKLPDNFLQIHRSFIVNTKKVSEVDLNYAYVKFGDKKVPVGRKFKEQLMQVLLKLG